MERSRLPDLSVSHQVLTLDPTVHRKPSPNPHGLRSTLEDQASLSPDSVLEPTLSSHSDLDSLSNASYVTSQLSAFPKSPPASKASPTSTGSWEKRAFPNGSQTSSTFPSLCTAASSGTSLSTVEELQAAPGPCTLALPSPLPGTTSSGTEGGNRVLLSQYVPVEGEGSCQNEERDFDGPSSERCQVVGRAHVPYRASLCMCVCMCACVCVVMVNWVLRMQRRKAPLSQQGQAEPEGEACPAHRRPPSLLRIRNKQLETETGGKGNLCS